MIVRSCGAPVNVELVQSKSLHPVSMPVCRRSAWGLEKEFA